MLAEVALAALALTVVLGLVMLAGLLRSGRALPRLVPFHLVSALALLVGWTAYTFSGDRFGDRSTALAWSVLAVAFVTNTLGDKLMLQAARGRAAAAGRSHPTGVRGYAAAAADVLSFTRPSAALHAILGAIGFFSVLMVTLGVGD